MSKSWSQQETTQDTNMSVKTTENQSSESKIQSPPYPASLHVNQTKTMKGKKTAAQMAHALTVFNQHIPSCGAAGRQQADCLVSSTTSVCVQGRCRPQLCHTKTLGIFQLFSAAICPQLLPKKHKYRLWNERGICFSHPRRCH